MTSLLDVANEALAEIRQISQRELYRNDYHAWRHDILGYRSYKRMNEITWQCLHGEKTKTAVASANGVSKSWEMSSMIAWASSVFEPGDVTSIVTAPSIQQVEKVIWAYLKSHFGQASARDNALPGRLSEKLEWIYDGENGKTFLAYGRVPSKGKEMAVFQGVRGVKGRVFVFSDEGGAIEKDMFTAMEAVTTGSGSRAVVFGNPDYPSAYWRRFWDKTKPEGQKWNTYNISAFDLPTLTGERVYEDPEMEERFRSAITSKDWVEDKQSIWAPNEARYLSKVMGQFPEDDDFAFFPQATINKAYDANIEDDASAPVILGADIARFGQDETVVAINRGGRVRIPKKCTWSKTDLVESARKIHKIAVETGATEVRIDSTGVGGGVYDFLDTMEEFFPRNYVVVGWDNGSAAPDPSQNANKRAFAHASLRDQMADGLIDLDYDDETLREELQAITYKYNLRGAVQVTPKDEIKKGLQGRSPDRLDAVILSAIDLTPWFSREPVGTVKTMDYADLPEYGLMDAIMAPGRPML
jgi:hypothetical protein